MQSWIDFIKAAVRPFIIVWGCIIYGVCIIKVIVVPDLLAVLVTAVIVEYFGERAVLRFKEKSSDDTTKEAA